MTIDLNDETNIVDTDEIDYITIPGKFDDSAITNVFINCFFSDLFNNNITH